jgi:3-phytase
MRRLPILVLFALPAFVLGIGKAAGVNTGIVHATLETEPFLAADDADADDPAIWVHPDRRDESIMVGTLKNAGLAVVDLDGETIQRIDYADEDARQNNVDVLYDVNLGGRTRDLAVVTDRGLDHLRVFSIDPAGAAAAEPLREVTVPNPPVVFEGDSDISAYGIAAWKSSGGEAFVAVSQRHRTAIALLRLVPGPSGTIGFERVDSITLPSTFALRRGGSWTPCAEEDDELPQVEGMVADSRRGFLFAAQEDVGIWRIAVGGGTFGGAKLFDRVREFGRAYTRTFEPDEEEFVCEIDEDAPSAGSDYLAADAEGLTIYRIEGARGYLLASSQGSLHLLGLRSHLPQAARDISHRRRSDRRRRRVRRGDGRKRAARGHVRAWAPRHP